jgi:hypothetical protein
MKKSNSEIRYYIYAIALFPVLLLLFTGIIMLNYHTGTPVETTVIGLDGHDWMLFHRIVAVISSVLVAMHLIVRTDWLKRFFSFKLKGKFKTANILIFVFFFLAFLTSFLSWLVFPNTDIAQLLRGIHNKLGLALIVLFIIHLVNYFKVIVNMTRKHVLPQTNK